MAVLEVYLCFRSITPFPLNIWERLPEITSRSCSSWEEAYQKRVVWWGVTDPQTRAQCKWELSFSKNALPFCHHIQHPLADPLPTRDSSVLWKWEPSSRAVWWKMWLQKQNRVGIFVYGNTFSPFSVLSFYFFSPNLQSLSICLCRRINLWYALYTWHFVFFAWHPEVTAMCTAHAASTTNKLPRPREYKDSRKGWDVSATKTSKLDLKPLYIKKVPCNQKFNWDPKCCYYRLYNIPWQGEGICLWASPGWSAPALPLSRL